MKPSFEWLALHLFLVATTTADSTGSEQEKEAEERQKNIGSAEARQKGVEENIRLGRLEISIGKLDEAIAHFQAAVTLDPYDPKAIEQLALAGQ